MPEDFILYTDKIKTYPVCPACHQDLKLNKISDEEGILVCPSCEWRTSIQIVTNLESEIKNDFLEWINVEPTRPATKKNYRVIATDTFDNTSWIVGEYDDLDYSKRVATAKGGTMLVTDVYDREGTRVFQAGCF